MDPISALGFACNVLDLIQLAMKTGAIMKQIYDSPEGLRKKHESLLEESKTLETVANGLEDIRSQISQTQSSLDTRMQEVAADCTSTNAAITEVLDKCKAAIKRSLASAVKSTIQLFLHKSDIENLQAKLDQRYRTLTSLTATKTLVEVAKLRTQLHHASHRLETQSRDSKQQQSLLLERLDVLDDSLAGVAKSEPLLEQLKDIFDAITVASDTMKAAKILESLRFPSMNDRFRTVHDPAPDTFNWIFDEPDILLQKQPGLTIAFPEWLRTGSGIFHIQGKPGCGKSTLMKFICEHESRDQLLGEWADRRALICSQFFFWRIGSSEEKSFRRLIRGLISDLIQHDPSLAKMLFPKSWRSDYSQRALSLARPLEFTDKDIFAGFDLVIQNQSLTDQHRICFFIDGLDEFDESLGYTYYSLTKKLRQWSHDSAGRVKFCVSSRELPVFLKAFGEKQRITIHIFTEKDITSLVEQKLDHNEMFQQLQKTKAKKCDKLKLQIIKNADGVFLWVILLLNQLEDALISEDFVAKLEEIVRSAPVELDEFFQHILDTIPRRYRQTAYTFLAMAMRMAGMLLSDESRELKYAAYDVIVSNRQKHIPAISYSFLLEALDRVNLREVTNNIPPPVNLDDDTLNARIALTKTQVAAHCRGLLEYRKGREWNSPSGRRAEPVFKFTHRSIPEFIQKTLSLNRESHGLDDQLVGELLAWQLLVNLRIRLYLPQIHEDSEDPSEGPNENPDLESSDESGGDPPKDVDKDARNNAGKLSPDKKSKKLSNQPSGGFSDDFSHDLSNVLSNELNKELDERKLWDNPFLSNGKFFDTALNLLYCLRETCFQNVNVTCQLLHLIDTELLQYRFHIAVLDELPDKARQHFGLIYYEDGPPYEQNASCLSMAALYGFKEFWVWYLEKSTTPLRDKLWYLENIIRSIINYMTREVFREVFSSKSPYIGFYPTIFETYFRAGISVDTVVASEQNLTLWHIFLRSIFFSMSSSNSYVCREDLPSELWDIIEIWLRYGADPRITFAMIPMDAFKNNPSRPKVVDEKSDMEAYDGSKSIITLYDLIKYHNPPNGEELLRLIDRNTIRREEAQENDYHRTVSHSERTI